MLAQKQMKMEILELRRKYRKATITPDIKIIADEYVKKYYITDAAAHTGCSQPTVSRFISGGEISDRKAEVLTDFFLKVKEQGLI